MLVRYSTIKYSIALLIALAFHFFLSTRHEGWLPVTTLVVMCTSTGSALYQGLWRYFWIVVTIMVLSFSILSHAFLFERLSEATIGAVIGIVINVMLFPDRVDKRFREACIPVWEAYADYFSSIIFLALKIEEDNGLSKKTVVRCVTALPGWAYEAGFDRTLQPGYCYVLMKTERVADLLLSMHSIASTPCSLDVVDAMREPMLRYADHMRDWMRSLASILALQKLSTGVEDGAVQLKQIEEQLEKISSSGLEWSESFKEYLHMAEFVYCLRELRAILLDLSISTALDHF